MRAFATRAFDVQAVLAVASPTEWITSVASPSSIPSVGGTRTTARSWTKATSTVVCVGVPNDLHRDVVVAAAEAGKARDLREAARPDAGRGGRDARARARPPTLRAHVRRRAVFRTRSMCAPRNSSTGRVGRCLPRAARESSTSGLTPIGSGTFADREAGPDGHGSSCHRVSPLDLRQAASRVGRPRSSVIRSGVSRRADSEAKTMRSRPCASRQPDRPRRTSWAKRRRNGRPRGDSRFEGRHLRRSRPGLLR